MFAHSFESITNYLTLPSLFGVVAVAAVLLWPFASRRRLVLLVQCIGSSAFAVHFVLLGAETAAVASCIALIQLLAAAVVQSRLRLWLIYGASGLTLLCLTAMTWHGLPSVFASIGSLLAMVARLQQSTVRMKVAFLASGPFWAIHNFIVGSMFGLTVDMVAAGSTIVALCRIGLPILLKKRHPVRKLRPARQVWFFPTPKMMPV
jgi:hypothetical protein